MNHIDHPDHDTLATYCLGGLVEGGTIDCESHLGTCESCRAYVAEFASLRDVLMDMPASLVLDDPTLSGEAVRSAVTPEPAGTAPRPLRSAPWFTRRWVLPTIVGSAALVVGAVALPRVLGDNGQQQSTQTITNVSGSVNAQMQLVAAATNSTFTLWLLHIPEGTTTLRLVVDMTNGASLNAGQWPIPGGDTTPTLRLDGSVPATAGQIADFRVETPSGATLVTLTMPHH